MIEKFFPKIRIMCTAVGIFLLIWLFCHLFIRSCGGPFPQRTRGPLAKKEFYQLGELPNWENMLIPKKGESNKTLAEQLIEGENISPLQFEYPAEIPSPKSVKAATNIQSVTPSVDE